MTDNINKLREHLEYQLSVKQYDAFHEKIGITRTKFTQLLNDPMNMDMRELLAFCSELEMDPKEFIAEFILPIAA